MALTGLTFALVLLAACGEDATAPDPNAGDPQETVQCEAATDKVEASVTVGAEVVFDWTPACDVALVLVEPLGSGADLWAVALPDESNGIAPPVTYGVVPPGAESNEAAAPLTPGETYELILWRIMPDGSAALLTVHQFTR
ncbi:MAG: hypothetical protein ABFS46_19695 [Myxococcota bacterium]